MQFAKSLLVPAVVLFSGTFAAVSVGVVIRDYRDLREFEQRVLARPESVALRDGPTAAKVATMMLQSAALNAKNLQFARKCKLPSDIVQGFLDYQETIKAAARHLGVPSGIEMHAVLSRIRYTDPPVHADVCRSEAAGFRARSAAAQKSATVLASAVNWFPMDWSRTARANVIQRRNS